MPTQFANSDNPHPTPAEYRKLVWLKAREIEAGKWLASVGTTLLPLIGGIICVALIIGDPAIARDHTTRLAIVGCGLRLLGSWNLWRCLTSAPYRLHCDQIDRYEAYRKEAADEIAAMRSEQHSLTAARDDAVKIVQERPLQMVEARRCLNDLASWLRKEAKLRPQDLSVHKQRFEEAVSGLLMQATSVWGDTDFSGKPHKSEEILQNRASQVDQFRNQLDPTGRFNQHWKPPSWISEPAGA